MAGSASCRVALVVVVLHGGAQAARGVVRGVDPDMGSTVDGRSERELLFIFEQRHFVGAGIACLVFLFLNGEDVLGSLNADEQGGSIFCL